MNIHHIGRYDQLGCGLSSNLPSVHVDSVDDLQHMVDDLREVLMFLKHSLGEAHTRCLTEITGMYAWNVAK